MSAGKIISEAARAILIMSIAGSALTLLLLALKPLIKNRVPKSVQYYLWAFVLIALLVPFSVFASVSISTPMKPVQEILTANVKSTAERREELSRAKYNASYEELDEMEQIDISYREIGLVNGSFNDGLLRAVVMTGATVFLIEIIQYFIFVIKLRRRRVVVKDCETALLQQLCKGGSPPRIFRNPLAPTPMLIGILRPAIYLPDIEYTETQLQNILLHELIHLRRHDVLVKWLAALACRVHWFNPLIYLVRHEIDRACELACDESVIKGLDTDGKQNYGETLISVAAEHKTPATIFSTTMSENKKILKERLGAIMKHKNFSKRAIILSSTLLVFVMCGTVVLGMAGGTGINDDNALSYDMDTDTGGTDIPETADDNFTATLNIPDDDAVNEAETEQQPTPEPEDLETTENDYVSGSYLWPAPDYNRISAGFGVRMHPIKKVMQTHYGIDIAAPSEAPVLAANTGSVVEMDENKTDGNYIKLDHGGGHQTFYAHLYGFAEGLETGDTIEKGDVIGYVGSTGKSTGSHLHFGVSVDGKFDNPLDYFQQAE